MADLFPGQRFGLTATTERADHRHHITRHHVGPVFYSDLMQISPTIYFQMVNFPINLKDPTIRREVRDKKGNINLGRLRVFMGKYTPRNVYLAHYILWLAKLGRQVLALTHSQEQPYILRDILAEEGFNNVGICTGLEDADARDQVIQDNQIILATANLASEGLDKQEFDTLLLMSPFGSEVAGANALQQSMGRVLRAVKGKDPVVIVIHDIGLSRFHRMCIAMGRILNAWPEKMGGPLRYKYIAHEDKPPIRRRA